MKYTISRGKSPVYIQLYEQLKRDIVEGVYKSGQKLPSKRLLAEELSISVITVEHTYSLLFEEGFIEPRERSGYFVCYTPDATFLAPVDNHRTAILQRHNIELADTFPFSVYAKTMRKILSVYGDDIFTRCDDTGAPELKSAIREYLLRSRGINVSENQIVIGAGAEYLYGIIVQMLGRERIYAVEKPSYTRIEQVYSANGATIQLLPLSQDGIESKALLKTDADILHITPYRSFPSGVTASASKKREYIRWVKEKKDRIIVEDDFESEFTLLSKAEETVFSLSGGSGVIYVNTFSKTVSPAVRIAYMILPSDMMPLYDERVGFYSCSVPYYNQLVLAEFINNGDFERSINRARRKLRRHIGN